MSTKIPGSLEERSASPPSAAAATAQRAAGIYSNVLKISVALSFIFGTLALSLYAVEYYYAHHAEDEGSGVPPSFVRFTHFAYVMGVGGWILTGFLAYLGPFFLEKYWGAATVVEPQARSSRLAGALLLSKRAALWGLVVGPSVGVFVYATWVEVPHARFTLYGDETEYSPTSAFDWTSVLVLASALPAGSAGMVSMGIYVFGAVARHSPLWSAYLVLPSEKNDANGCMSPRHSNLMMDALRLHQVSGYITFWFFFLHSVFYMLLYGFEGLYENAADEDEYLSGNYTFKLDNLDATARTEDSSEASPGFITLFLSSVWKAIYPPPECLPLTGPGRDYTWNPFWEGDESHDSHDSHDEAEGFMGQPWDYDPCYGLYRNFQGLLAFLAVLVLVLTSLNFVRRRSYRFFYVSHILTATMMVVTMCLHYPRIVFYLFPSLVCYLATTIPTVVQGWFSAYLDGGVEIDEWTVLETSKTKQKKKKIGFSFGKGGDDDGVLELTFVVNPKAGEALEATATKPRVSYRPKSVRICVPSISLLWYPFTVIQQTPVENEEGQKVFRCTVLLGTVGYFTKSLWKKFHDLHMSIDASQNGNIDDGSKVQTTGGIETGSKGSCGDTGLDFSSSDREGNETKTTKNMSDQQQQQPRRPPLVLVDGFYSGATDWIKDARSHDSLLIAAGGTGVTPFLAFLPQILSLVLDNQASDEGQESSVPNVSFMWCCRDEALIRHVVKTYLLPLLRRVQERKLDQNPQSQPAKMRLMIYNTSRKSDDGTLLDLSSSQSPTRIAHSKTTSRRGASMQPSRVQYHPRLSNPSQAAQAATTFLSIAIVGVAVLVWQWHHILDKNRRLFGVRLHGLYAIAAWSFIVGIGAEVYQRYYGSSRAAKEGIALGKEVPGSSTSPDTEDAEELGCAEEGGGSLGATKNLRLSSLVPGKLHCYPDATTDGETAGHPALEFILSNGRPILGNTGEKACSCWKQNKPDDGVETGETEVIPTYSEVALSELASANRPGVFYCGAEKLLEAIQKCVKQGQAERRQDLKKSSATQHPSPKITGCAYYKESFEM